MTTKESKVVSGALLELKKRKNAPPESVPQLRVSAYVGYQRHSDRRSDVGVWAGR